MGAVAGCRSTSPCAERTFPGIEAFDDRKKSQLATGRDQPKEKQGDRYTMQLAVTGPMERSEAAMLRAHSGLFPSA